ncbi:hypothetical protein ACS0TY_034026 [Phlomoides rotata]
MYIFSHLDIVISILAKNQEGILNRKISSFKGRETCPISSQQLCSLFLPALAADPKVKVNANELFIVFKRSSVMHQDSATSLSNANPHEQQFSVSKNLSFKVDYPAQQRLQVRDQHCSSTESTSLSHQDLTAMGKTSSQDQCASSDSVHDESYHKHGQDMKAALFMCNPELPVIASQAEINQPIVQFPYAYNDPYFNGLFTTYGLHSMMQPQVMPGACGRVPLPVDLSEDGPIYVNAKQYHGILRRRQTRAKLEAQNKLVKTRKAYLHESRHQHALNRVRGTGGRFMSTKRQQSGSVPATTSQGLNYGESEANKYGAFSAAQGMRVSGGDGVMMQQADGRFSSVPPHMGVAMQGSGGLVYNGNRHYASIVR